MNLDAQTYRKDRLYMPGHGYGAVRQGGPTQRPAHDIRSFLVHTTNNPNGNTYYPSEAIYLRDSSNVSIHYVVSSHNDTVVQILPDFWIAWHAGDCIDPDFENPHSIGIEIAWADGQGPLPQLAIDNTTALVHYLLSLYPWIEKIDTHRHQAPTRKHDPSGWPDAAFNQWRATLRATDTTPEPVTPPLDAAAVRTYRIAIPKSWVRALPSISKGTFVKTIALNTHVKGVMVPGEPFTAKNGRSSSEWLQLEDGSGYVWAGQVKPIRR